MACLLELKGDARVQIIFEKLPFDISKGQSLAVLASKERATQPERVALSLFAAEAERCLDTGSDWRIKNYPPVVISLLSTYRVSIISAFADLYSGTITFGEMAKTRSKLTADLKNSIDEVYRNIQDQKSRSEKQRLEVESTQAQLDRQIQDQREAIAQQQRFAQQQALQQQEEGRRLIFLQMMLNKKPF